MNKRDLRKALDGHANGTDDSSGRRLAYLVATDAANGARVPRSLRDPLHRVALLCLACDAADLDNPNPIGSKPFADLYTEREAAYRSFADAALAHFRRKKAAAPNETADETAP